MAGEEVDMARGPLVTEAERQEIWARRDAGEPVAIIARRLNRGRDTVRVILAASGGVRPRPRQRPRVALTTLEREEISRGLAAGESCNAIATRVGRAASSVSREVRRNGGRRGYRAADAELAAAERRRRPKPCKLALQPRLYEVVVRRLGLDWSPQQISNWLKLEYAGDPEMQISHETIYLTLFVQARGTLRKELAQHLRTRRTFRQPRRRQTTGQGQLSNRVLISERPAEVADRAVPGHWEGDLLLGRRNDAIGTLVERSSRYVVLFQLPGTKVSAEGFRESLTTAIQRLPDQLRRSLTWDQGKEMADHARFTVDTGVRVYFCDPSSPWQRGTNENTNGLLRQYFPRGKSVSAVTQDELNRVADLLNTRPRQTLGWKTPAQAFERLVGAATD